MPPPPPFNDSESGAASNSADKSVVLPPPQDSRDSLPTVVTSSNCFPVTLQFIDVCYKIKLNQSKSRESAAIGSCLLSTTSVTGHGPVITEKTIINGVTGMVNPGQILAILGPSGSGKSTLLNALAGRLHGNSLTGSILINGQKPSKHTLRRTGFVAQDDILFPHLTVRETLVFCSLLRLPAHLSEREKIVTAESVMSELGLSKCDNTIIGNAFVRGISGGERKRVSIAQEMIVNPGLLLLDEPTSGLDATAAFRLVAALAATASTGKGRSVVMSVHQPSSRVYQMFESVLVLSEGKCIYFGKGNEAMDYFDSLGFSPSFPMNPADFLLDLANDVWFLDGANTNERDKLVNVKHSLVAKYNAILGPKVKAACLENKITTLSSRSPTVSRSTNKTNLITYVFMIWFNQFSILLRRSLKERKHEAFNSLRVFQVMAASFLAGFMWWHSDSKDIQDRLGLLFFISIFWGVLPSFNAVFAFPQERAIYLKERASGMYTLSPYFMARIVGDLPMELILPTIFITITYWMAGLKAEFVAFVLTWLVLLGYVLVSQGLGLALGAMIMDAKQASTIVTVTMLAFVVTGGFYVHKVPACLGWMKYISTTFYCYRLLVDIQYGEGKGMSSLLACTRYGNDDMASCKFIEEDIRGQIPRMVSVTALLVMFVGYRLLAYLALRRIKP